MLPFSLKVVFYNIWCELVKNIRRGYFYIRKREPRLFHFNVSDAVLVNERSVRIEYAGMNISSVVIPGLIRSHRMEDQLTFNLPEGVNEIKIYFIGVRRTIERQQRFTFLKVAINDSAFDRNVQTKRFIHYNQNSILQTMRFPILTTKKLVLYKSNPTILRTKSPKKISIEELKNKIQYT